MSDEANARSHQPARLVLAHYAHAPLVMGAAYVLDDLDEVAVGRGGALTTHRFDDGERRRLDIAVPDDLVSRCHVLLTCDHSRWQLHDLGSKNGTLVNGHAVSTVMLEDRDVIVLGRTFWVFRDRRIVADADPLEGLDCAITAPTRADTLRTFSSGLAATFHRLRQVAPTSVSVLVTGATGTGKEVVSRVIHRDSGRGGAYVAVNCGALPRPLIESELFGVKRGAFTGATEDRQGLVRAARDGTLFLDEIGELPLDLQAVLLRVLEEREVTPIGATAPEKVDVRIVAATNRDLDVMVQKGEFRKDLLARLAGFRVRLPRLAERVEDLGLLLAAALRRAAPDRAEQLTLERELSVWLFQHAWPGNVRELVQLAGTLAAMTPHFELRRADLPVVAPSEATERALALVRDAGAVGPSGARRRRLEILLRHHQGNIAAVARALTTSRSQVRRLVKRFGLEVDSFRP